MTLYPSPERLALAVSRLQASKAKPVLADYLICTRALQRGADAQGLDQVPLSQADPYLQEAIDAVIGVEHEDVEWNGPPFLFIFDDNRLYRHEKHRSNGTADTVANWRGAEVPPLNIVGSRPRNVRANPDAEAADVVDYFYKNQDLPRPLAIDLALWIYRYTDVHEKFGHEPDASELIDECRKEVGLPVDVFDALFDPDVAEAALQWGEDLPEPSDFCPETPEAATVDPSTPENLAADVEKIINSTAARGFTFEPWQIAAFITAVRTKPFVILAGISGTGKTKLPRLVAEATTSEFDLVPVRPDWTDSSDLVGYDRITGEYVPGPLLRAASAASSELSVQRFLMLDEIEHRAC